MGNRTRVPIAVVLLTLVVLAGCDPASRLENQEYVVYLDNYQRWDVGDVVSAFNHLDSKRAEFNCTKELDAAQRARWREEAGPVKIEMTKAGTSFEACLDAFHQSSGLTQGKIQFAVLSHWVNHNFVPEVQKAIDAEVSKATGRLEDASCVSDECKALTVVGDLAVIRAGLKVAVAWQDARDQCEQAGYGGLRPWRLPTKEELVALRESNKLASDVDMATYWSGTREFGEKGEIRAWVLRFDLASLTDDSVQPKLLPFDTDGAVTLAKVRCVHDLSKGTAPANAIDEMEKVIQGAGCPRYDWDPQGNRWWEWVRYRDGYLVSKNLGKSGGELKQACGEAPWCKLRWSTPSKGVVKSIADDPWFGGGKSSCATKLPGS